MKKSTTEEFIKKATKVHGNKYDYSKTNYVNAKTKITIKCLIHGEFKQMPDKHLKGQGCSSCGGTKKSTTNDFITKSTEVYENEYDYSKVNYINNKTKVTIICKIHGEFEQKPKNHLDGHGCPGCKVKKIRNSKTRNNNKLTTNKFIEEAIKIHGGKYNYLKVNYIDSQTKITIICPVHGEFEQTPSNHLNGRKCPVCSGGKLNTKEFVRKAIKIHGNKYNYSKVKYVNNRTKVTVICPDHGEFEQKANDHLNGYGCKKCGYENNSKNNRLTIKEFIEKATKIHGNKYDYSKIEYVNAMTKTIIICPIHGEFKQIPSSHLSGHGCPGCSSSKGENKVREYLITNNIIFEEQKTFNNCVYKNKLKFDFYLPETNTAIEYDGLFHFRETNLKNNLTESLIKDGIKDRYCMGNDINLIRIGFWESVKEVLDFHIC